MGGRSIPPSCYNSCCCYSDCLCSCTKGQPIPNLSLSLPSSQIETHLNVIFHVCMLLPIWTVKMWQFVGPTKALYCLGFFCFLKKLAFPLTNKLVRTNYRSKFITPIILPLSFPLYFNISHVSSAISITLRAFPPRLNISSISDQISLTLCRKLTV